VTYIGCRICWTKLIPALVLPAAAAAAAVSSPGEPTNWAINIANIFLAPFGIGSSDSSVSAEGTKGDLLKQTQKRLPQAMPVHVACKDNRWAHVQMGGEAVII
jgi:hypothetical protein